MGCLGAPAVVNRYCVLNVLRHWIIAMTDTKSVVGFRSGNVMCQKSCHLSAPSIRAASCRVLGIAPIPATKMTVK